MGDGAIMANSGHFDAELDLAALRALAERLVARHGRGRVRDLVVEQVDGDRAMSSRWSEALRQAGYRAMGTGLRYFAEIHK